MRNKFIVVIAVAIMFAIVVYFLTGSTERNVKKNALIYIEAMQNMDFKKVFYYHAPSQKKIALVYKVPASPESQQHDVDMIFKDQMTSFEQATPATCLTNMWAEKFLFIKDMNYKFTSIKLLEDIERPSLPIEKRWNALVEVEAEYTHQETAPDIEGKVKKATYIISMINIKNVARAHGWEEKTQEDRWLFDSISLKDKSIVYW